MRSPPRARTATDALDARIRTLPQGTVQPAFLAQVHAKLPNERLVLDQRSTDPSA